jgi:hypothetical protein
MRTGKGGVAVDVAKGVPSSQSEGIEGSEQAYEQLQHLLCY